MQSCIVFAGSLVWHGILLSFFPPESETYPEVIEQFIYMALVLKIGDNCF